MWLYIAIFAAMSKKTFLTIGALAVAGAATATQPASPDTTGLHATVSEVVVTGSNNPTGRNLLPFTVSTVGNAQIEATGKGQLLSTISGVVPSLFVTERNVFGFGISNGGSGGIKIRGVGGSPTNAVLMMVDGQPQFAGIYSHHVADSYDAEHVDHVEVLRGPGSVLYGSNAMGGVINVITKTPRDGAHLTLKSEYGSWNTWRTSLTGSVRQGKFSAMVSGAYDRTDGVTQGFDFKQGSLYAKVGYDFTPNWKATADYNVMKFKGNDPIYPTLSDPASTAVYHQNIVRGATSLAVSNSYGSTNGVVRLYYSYGNHYIDDPNHFHSLDDRLGVLAYQNFSPWQGAAATVGFDFDHYTGSIPMSGGREHTEGSMSTIGNKHINEYSPYVTLSQNLAGDLLTLNAGLRMAASSMFSTHWIPQGGIALRPATGLTIKANVAKGYRNPSFRELYLYRPANPDLEPENMMNYELSVEKSWGRILTASITGYWSEGSDMIQTVDMKNVNTGEFTNKGIELALSSQLSRTVAARASYSYLHTSLDNLTAAPKNQYYLGLGWQALPALRIDADLRGVGGLYVAQDIDNQNYAVLNTRITYTPVQLIDLFLQLNNITDAQYVINRGYDMPGFNLSGGFKLKL